MRVIYIAGMSHSGSTVLNLMLNAHPEIFAVGELIDLNRGAGGARTLPALVVLPH